MLASSGRPASASTPDQRLEVLPLYRPGDVDIDYERDLADPGSYPYTRGSRPARTKAGHESSDQIVRELSGEGRAEWSNEQFRYLLEHGATGLDVIGDAPTMASMDADHAFAAHAVGNQGVSLTRGIDYERLYAGIPLDRVSVSHSLPTAFGVAGFYGAAKRLGFDPGLLRGSMILAPLFSEDTCYSHNVPLELHMRLAVDTIIFSSERMPRFHPFVEDTYFISDGSIEAIEEMALGFIELREVVRRTVARGLAVDAFAPRIALLVNCRMNVFEEVAKIRASRRLYARMMREEFGAEDPRSLAINVAAHTSGASMTAEQLTNNIVRGASQTLTLTMAGVRAMEISAFDEAIRTPSRAAHIVGIRTQQVIQEETGVGDVADPLGGSYYVEALTDEFERRIEERVHFIEGLGDILELSTAGFFRSIFAEAMVDRAREVADGTRRVVGVNCHRLGPEEDSLLRDIVEQRIEPCYDLVQEVKEWRASRDMRAVVGSLDALTEAGRSPTANTTAAIVDAFEAGASMGECIGVLRQVYGAPYDPLDRAAERPR
ncbi:MAG TPA: methylmalonyl-CoA mutase family protein [Solirubrobacteraceae bacterium]